MKLFLLKLNKYFWWMKLFLLKLNKYFCWMKLFLLKLNKYFCWMKLFLLKLNKYFCWMKLFFCWILQHFANHIILRVVYFPVKHSCLYIISKINYYIYLKYVYTNNPRTGKYRLVLFTRLQDNPKMFQSYTNEFKNNLKEQTWYQWNHQHLHSSKNMANTPLIVSYEFYEWCIFQ